MKPHATRTRIRAHSSRGFTLIEIVFVLLLSAILVAWAFPSLLTSIHNNQVASQNASLVALLNFTRAESIRRNESVTIVLTPQDGGWDAVVEDPNNEAEIEGCVLGQLRCISNTGVLMSLDTAGVTFNNRGYIRDSEEAWTPETLFLQHQHCEGENQRTRIDITPTGQVSSCRLPCDSTDNCSL